MEILFWVFVALFVVCLIGWIISLVRGSDARYIWNIGICGCALIVNLINLLRKIYC